MMQRAAVLDWYLRSRYLFFKWRYSMTVARKLVLALAMACLTGLLAQICIPLPFTPVPITGQVFGVLLSGVICGGLFGSISQIVYVTMGFLGVPWFAGGVAGNLIGFPVTAGYLLGFVVAPLFIGWNTDRYIGARRFISQLKYMMLGVGIIYLSGAIFLGLSLRIGFTETVTKGVLPFIPIDLLKAVVVAGLSSSILPKSSYNGEKDRHRFINSSSPQLAHHGEWDPDCT